MKSIYAVGCSFTKFPNVNESELWPAVLANKFDCCVINDGIPGGSNYRSFRKITEFIDTYPKSLEDVFFIIEVTSPLRFEFSEDANNGWSRVVMNLPKVRTTNGVIPSNKNIQYTSAQSLGELMRNFFEARKLRNIGEEKLSAKLINYNEQEEYYEFIRQLSQLSFYFERHNLKYTLLSFIIPKLTTDQLSFVNNNFNWLVKNDVHSSNIHSMYSEVDEETAKINNYHPTKENHIEIANFIHKNINIQVDKDI